MRALFQLLFQSGGFITFVLAEALCLYLIVSYNTNQKGVWDNTFGIVAGNVLEKRRTLMRYSELPQVVDSLMLENARLRSELLNKSTLTVTLLDTAYTFNTDSVKGAKSFPAYDVIPAAVINNSTSKASNWVMLNKGSADGVTRHCGVISNTGIVGIVRYLDDHFCLAMSVLHQQTKISASLQGQLGSLVWTGKHPGIMQLNDIPKDVEPAIGDTVLTSGYSSMFPKDYPIGVVLSKELPRGSNFYSIQVKLLQNPGSADNVFIVKNLFYNQLDSLQTAAKNE